MTWYNWCGWWLFTHAHHVLILISFIFHHFLPQHHFEGSRDLYDMKKGGWGANVSRWREDIRDCRRVWRNWKLISILSRKSKALTKGKGKRRIKSKSGLLRILELFLIIWVLAFYYHQLSRIDRLYLWWANLVMRSCGMLGISFFLEWHHRLNKGSFIRNSKVRQVGPQGATFSMLSDNEHLLRELYFPDRTSNLLSKDWLSHVVDVRPSCNDSSLLLER